jgi:hypothetical protein
MSDPQSQLNTEAIKLAAAAQTSAERAITIAEANHEKQTKALHEHSKHDDDRFNEVLARMSSGFAGIYNRLWIAAGAVIVAMAAVILIMFEKAV